jgi:hypothetical protein
LDEKHQKGIKHFIDLNCHQRGGKKKRDGAKGKVLLTVELTNT